MEAASAVVFLRAADRLSANGVRIGPGVGGRAARVGEAWQSSGLEGPPVADPDVLAVGADAAAAAASAAAARVRERVTRGPGAKEEMDAATASTTAWNAEVKRVKIETCW